MGGYAFGMGLLAGLTHVLLIVLLCLSLYTMFRSMRGNRPFHYARALSYRAERRRSFLCKLLLVPGADRPAYKERQRLLTGSGLRIEAGLYMAIVRLLICTAAAIGLFVLLSGRYAPGLLPQADRIAILILAIGVIAIGAADKPILERLQQFRRYRVMRDVDVLSRQLLYYSGYSANLHGKLMRCLPFAKALRSEWYQLTGEWYHNAELALRRFRERVATEEGNSFAETLNALRQYDHDRYYELLKQRISDYKEKLTLFKDSRKESLSYLLYVMSGVPILFTFRLFVYPWVAEGQKLFDSLG